MDETTDAVKAAWRIVRFFARESCGKCTPCREGTTWLEKILRRMLDGQGRPGDLDKLMDICDNISPQITWPPKQTTICPLGPSVVSPIASAVMRFRDEFTSYALGEAASPPPTAPSKRDNSDDARRRAGEVTVAVHGKAYLSKPPAASEVPA
jgi:NADH:ubiquinone oxidoreductase subunit F (NADH-binding)